MSASPFCVVLVSAPARGAAGVAKKIVQSRLAACVNIVPAVRSHYWWKGTIESATESLLVIKTRRGALKKLFVLIKRHHPYDVPEMISLSINAGFAPYLQWLGREIQA